MNKSIIILLILFLYSAATAFGGEIKGIVKDGDGSPLPGVSVFIEGSGRGNTTNESGAYNIPGLRSGAYWVRASMLGFRTERKFIMIAEETGEARADFILTQVAIGLGEVEVTANKYRENLQTVPAAVSAVSMEKLDDLTIRDRTDLSALAPNSFIAETGSHMTDLINIRGMFPSSPFGATTMFFYDGVPIYGYGMNPMYLNDLERIEILRGPQGTLYGRNALAGVVNLISQKPSNVARYNVGLDFGNYNERRFTFGASLPVMTDRLFARVSGYYADRDGYFTNVRLAKNAGATKGYGGTFNLRYFPSEAFSAEMFTNLEYIDESPWPFATTPAAAMEHPYQFAMDIDNVIRKQNLIGSLKLEYELGFMNIVSTTAYQDISKFYWHYDGDLSEYDVLGFIETSPSNIFSQELRFESVNTPVKWLAGAFYCAEKTANDYSGILGSVWAQANQVPFSPIYSTTRGNTWNSGLAGFGQLSYTIANRLDLTAGLRYESQKIETDITTRYLYNDVPIPAPPFNSIDTNKLKKEFRFVSPKLSAAYRFDEWNMLYASASRGFHGAGFNSSSNKVVPFYDPEYTWNYEVGYKTALFDNTLRLNTDVFFIDWRQQQLLVIGDLSSVFQTITNAGRTISKGIELEVSAVPMHGMSVGASFGYLEAKYDEFSFHDTKRGKDTVYSYSGHSLPFAPEFSSSMNIKYELPAKLFGLAGQYVFVLSHQYTAPYYMSHVNLFRSAARNLLGGKFGLALRSLDVFVWVKNLLDYRYVYGAYEYRGGEQAYLGAPRTVGVGVNFRY